MSRGLSDYQKAALELLREDQLNFRELAPMIIGLKRKKRGFNFNSPFYIEVTEIPDHNSIYRMMNSLEKRGLVARLLHKRPAVWFPVTWEDNKPTFEYDPSKSYPYFAHFTDRGRKVEFRTKGQYWLWNR